MEVNAFNLFTSYKDFIAHLCSTNPQWWMHCSNSGMGTSQMRLQFSVYLNNPKDQSLTPECGQRYQFKQLKEMIQVTHSLKYIWLKFEIKPRKQHANYILLDILLPGNWSYLAAHPDSVCRRVRTGQNKLWHHNHLDRWGGRGIKTRCPMSWTWPDIYREKTVQYVSLNFLHFKYL